MSLAGASATPITAAYATQQRTAIEGVDYLGRTGTVTFAPGATTATIAVPVLADAATEINETFVVTLSALTGAVSTRSQAIGTIANDNVAVNLTAEFRARGRDGSASSTPRNRRRPRPWLDGGREFLQGREDGQRVDGIFCGGQ